MKANRSKRNCDDVADSMNSQPVATDYVPAFPKPPIATVAHVRVVNGQGGGPDKTILNSPRFLEGFGYRAICAYMHPPDDPGFQQLRKKAELWKAPLLSLPDRGVSDLSIVTRLLRVCREHRVDIWHAHDYKSNLVGLLLKPFWPMKLVTTVHGWVSSAGRIPLYYRLDRHLLRHYERVICVSEDLLNECKRHRVAADRCTLIHNAIDTDEFAMANDKASEKAKAGFSPDQFVIGAVGRLAAEKGFDILIRAIDCLLAEGHNLKLVIFGEGDDRLRLQALVERLGRSDRIKLVGYQADVCQAYRIMDAFALSSLREGLPNVVLEALATGVPVVATRIAGVPSLIEDNSNGLLVSPNSVDELTATIRRLIVDADLRQRLSVAGRRTVEENYSFAVRMSKIRALYDVLLGRHADTPLFAPSDHN